MVLDEYYKLFHKGINKLLFNAINITSLSKAFMKKIKVVYIL
jgi:hypothetical protein